VVQYAIFLTNALHGDLGRSIRSGLPVTEELGQRFPNTLVLATAATAITVLFGVPLGVASAVRPRSIVDRASLLGSLVGISAPAFVLGILLQLIFAVRLGVLPSAGIGTPQHLALPALTLG